MESFLPESMVFLLGQITHHNGQAHFENLETFAAKFLKCV